MKYRISRQSRSSVSESEHRRSPGYSTGWWRCSMTGERRSNVLLSIPPGSPVLMPVIIIPGEPGKPENDSWKLPSLLIPINRLSPAWRSPHIRSTTFFMPRNSLNSVTDPDTLTSMSWLRIRLRRDPWIYPRYPGFLFSHPGQKQKTKTDFRILSKTNGSIVWRGEISSEK